MRTIKQKSLKLLSLTMIIALGSLALSHTGYTLGYYNNAKGSNGNIFSTGGLDLVLSQANYESLIAPGATGEETTVIVDVMPADGSLDMQYTLAVASPSPLDPLCHILTVEAKQEGVSRYQGPLSELLAATSTDFGAWEFIFNLPTGMPVANGEKCELAARFSAWRADTATPAASGYTDEELLVLSFTIQTAELVELVASPIAPALIEEIVEEIEEPDNQPPLPPPETPEIPEGQTEAIIEVEIAPEEVAEETVNNPTPEELPAEAEEVITAREEDITPPTPELKEDKTEE